MSAVKDERWMREALRLARAGTGSTYPNPCVGAVLVKRGRLLGRARSDVTGGPHAEVRALEQAGRAARGATLYVTLEPCNHRGRTPPCVDALLEAGVARVVVALEDPADHVAGAGVRRLRRRGVEVELGLLAGQARAVHRHYLHHVASGRPFVTLKLATSLDGQIATAGGDSKWITGEPARRSAHRLRASHHAIAVGAETVLRDNPRLSVRLARGVDPLPVVFDTRLRIARAGAKQDFHLLRGGVVFVHGPGASKRARKVLAEVGADALEVPLARDRGSKGGSGVDLDATLDALGRRSIRSLMVEGGGRLVGSFVAAAAWQELWLYRAPVILGAGRSGFAGLDFARVADAPRLAQTQTRKLGVDQLTIYRPLDEDASD